jgi:hypothetical protein
MKRKFARSCINVGNVLARRFEYMDSKSLSEHCLICFFALLIVFQLMAFKVMAQQSQTPAPQVSPIPSLEKQFLKNIVRDQKKIWTAPFGLHTVDAKWLVPLGLSTTGLATD